jgi:hypothetical protein
MKNVICILLLIVASLSLQAQSFKVNKYIISALNDNDSWEAKRTTTPNALYITLETDRMRINDKKKADYKMDGEADVSDLGKYTQTTRQATDADEKNYLIQVRRKKSNNQCVLITVVFLDLSEDVKIDYEIE